MAEQIEQSYELANYKSLQGLYIRQIGEGEVIVFLHGGPGSEHRFFLPHVLPLSEKFKLVFYDQRGCGNSKQFNSNQYTMKSEVEALESIRQELNVEKINLFGESWGTMLALLYATSYPERVNKMFLTAAIGVTSEGFLTFSEELEKRVSEEDKVKLSSLQEDLKSGNSTIEDIFGVLDKYYVYSEDTLKRKKKATFNTSVNDQIGKDIIENYDLTNKLEKISDIPILIAQGSNDILSPNLIRRLLVDYIPRARLVEVEQCGHWTVIEKPSEINKIANEFFNKS